MSFLRSCCISSGILLSTTLVACGGGGGGEGGSSDNVDPCSVLKSFSFKVAGGQSCSVPPRSVAIVASDQGYCTGTFITSNHVLTAAHCIPDAGEVVIGARGYRGNVIKAVTHPLYNGSVNSPFDVAVVTVRQPTDAPPVPLLLSQSVKDGDSVVVYGYGVDQEGLDIVSRVEQGGLPLKATTLDIVGVEPGTVTSQSDGTGDSCQGDSGGALLLNNEGGEPGVVALVRAGPPGCVSDSGLPSENTNTQSSGVTQFIRQQASGVRLN